MQAVNITSNHKVKVDFCLPGFSAPKTVTRECYVGDYYESRYGMIMGRYLLSVLGSNFKIPQKVIEGGDIPFERCTSPIVDLGTYKFKIEI